MSPEVVLISTYELGRQPFGLASPAAWLRQAGASVTCLDLSREKLREEPVRSANLVAFYVPMHTATRVAARAVETVRRLNPRAHLCFYGLYAPLNESYLRGLGAETILGGEFEQGLVRRLEHLLDGAHAQPDGYHVQKEPLVSLARQTFLVPDRSGLPGLSSYAQLTDGQGQLRTVGYTEATRGCKHLCRHCPVVPVYNGAFRVVQRDVVLEDIRRQVAAGAEHITFGDPDFLNGVRHSLGIVRTLHREFPRLTYDVTTKVEHLRKHAAALPVLAETGCQFVTSAVESVDDRVLQLLDKGHTRADFYDVVELCRRAGLVLAPTFVAFTPWITLRGYCDLLAVLDELDLVEQVAPVQLAIRLLIPTGSRLLELEEVRQLVAGGFGEAALSYRWKHPDPRVDRLCGQLQRAVWQAEKQGRSRRAIFSQVWELAHNAAGISTQALRVPDPYQRTTVPYLNEPWYC